MNKIDTRISGGTVDEQPDIKKKGAWTLEPHICRKCFGRLVSQPVADPVSAGLRLYVCTNCGAEAQSAEPAAVCCCGIKIKKAGRNGTKSGSLVDAGVRCIENPEPSPMFPSQIIASEVVKKR